MPIPDPDCWELIFLELNYDQGTLFNVMLVNRALFYIAGSILFKQTQSFEKVSAKFDRMPSLHLCIDRLSKLQTLLLRPCHAILGQEQIQQAIAFIQDHQSRFPGLLKTVEFDPPGAHWDVFVDLQLQLDWTSARDNIIDAARDNMFPPAAIQRHDVDPDNTHNPDGIMVTEFISEDSHLKICSDVDQQPYHPPCPSKIRTLVLDRLQELKVTNYWGRISNERRRCTRTLTYLLPNTEEKNAVAPDETLSDEQRPRPVWKMHIEYHNLSICPEYLSDMYPNLQTLILNSNSNEVLNLWQAPRNLRILRAHDAYAKSLDPRSLQHLVFLEELELLDNQEPDDPFDDVQFLADLFDGEPFPDDSIPRIDSTGWHLPRLRICKLGGYVASQIQGHILRIAPGLQELEFNGGLEKEWYTGGLNYVKRPRRKRKWHRYSGRHSYSRRWNHFDTYNTVLNLDMRTFWHQLSSSPQLESQPLTGYQQQDGISPGALRTFPCLTRLTFKGTRLPEHRDRTLFEQLFGAFVPGSPSFLPRGHNRHRVMFPNLEHLELHDMQREDEVRRVVKRMAQWPSMKSVYIKAGYAGSNLVLDLQDMVRFSGVPQGRRAGRAMRAGRKAVFPSRNAARHDDDGEDKGDEVLYHQAVVSYIPPWPLSSLEGNYRMPIKPESLDKVNEDNSALSRTKARKARNQIVASRQEVYCCTRKKGTKDRVKKGGEKKQTRKSKNKGK